MIVPQAVIEPACSRHRILSPTCLTNFTTGAFVPLVGVEPTHTSDPKSDDFTSLSTEALSCIGENRTPKVIDDRFTVC